MKRWLRLFTILAVLLLIFGIFIQSVYADKAELEKIKKAIKDKGVDWEADETNVSQLVPQDRKMKLGAILDQTGKPTKVSKPLPGASSASLDWRSKGGNWVTSVKDQGQCGSCWAFGAIAALESLKLITSNTPDPVGTSDAIDLSEQDLVSCCTENNGCNGGWMVVTYDYLRDEGAPNEACFPYQAKDDLNGAPCEQPCSDIERVKIASWGSVAQDVNALKAAIANHPVTVGFNVYTDFYYYRKGIYKHVSGGFEGGHSVCIVGWNDKSQYFIVKNSWGTRWGESGFFRIAYSQVTDSAVSFGRSAGDFEMTNTTLAPPRSVSTATALWGHIKEL